MSADEEVACAVRGFHYYRRHWKPVLNETLKCLHDKENPFDIFAIKTCSWQSTQAVGQERFREQPNF